MKKMITVMKTTESLEKALMFQLRKRTRPKKKRASLNKKDKLNRVNNQNTFRIRSRTLT